MRQNPRRTLIALCLTLPFSGCVFANLDLSPQAKPYTETVLKSGSSGKIALIDIHGTITDSQPSAPIFGQPQDSMMKRVLDQLALARADDSVGAVVLKIDSPGGSVTASDIIYRELVKFKKDTGKKVVAALMDTAASGGYYVALPADTIVAHPTTVTGSIGVIMYSFDVSGLMKKIGVAVEPVKSAAKKDIGSPFRPSSPAEKQVLQAIINEMYVTFLARVSANRKGISPATLKRMTDGRIFTASQAKRAGFIDDIGYLDKAFAQAARLSGQANPSVIRYHRENEKPSGIYAKAASRQTTPLIHVDLTSFLGPLKPGFYYYWNPGFQGMRSR